MKAGVSPVQRLGSPKSRKNSGRIRALCLGRRRHWRMIVTVHTEPVLTQDQIQASLAHNQTGNSKPTSSWSTNTTVRPVPERLSFRRQLIHATMTNLRQTAEAKRLIALLAVSLWPRRKIGRQTGNQFFDLPAEFPGGEMVQRGPNPVSATRTQAAHHSKNPDCTRS